MGEFLCKLSLYWGILALLYALLLRGETFFRANRAYLLLATLAGLALAGVERWPDWIPSAPLGILSQPMTAFLPLWEVGITLQAPPKAAAFSIAHWLLYVWAFGTALALCHIAIAFWQLHQMAQNTHRKAMDGTWVVWSDTISAPFSFFRWIFVPENLSQTPEALASILAHERAHAKAAHSADMLWMECLCAVFWFHPLAYWYRRALRLVHEYEADAVAARLTTKKQYGLLLVQQLQCRATVPVAHHFFQSPLKQRLRMLAKSASPRLKAWKYLFALPVLGMAVSFSQAPPLKDQAVPSQAPHELFELAQRPKFPGGEKGLMQYLTSHIHYPEGAKAAKVQGAVAVVLVLDETGHVTEATCIKSPDNRQDLAEEVIRVVRAMPQWTPGIGKDGRPVRVRYTLPVKFKLQ